eukprot:12316574-Alexandrium_andersonii.AAC.1
MSASLVGSEMCIRDSSYSQCYVRCSPSSWAVYTTVSPAWSLSAARARAVSYTHLTLPTICSV